MAIQEIYKYGRQPHKAMNTNNKQTLNAIPAPSTYMQCMKSIGRLNTKNKSKNTFDSIRLSLTQIISRMHDGLFSYSENCHMCKSYGKIWLDYSFPRKITKIAHLIAEKFDMHTLLPPSPPSPHLPYKMLKFQFIFCHLETRLTIYILYMYRVKRTH